ncbi:hypothetical protein L2E82_52627 [Cichorium intybus]|nr:hypothetical protein L2E82_52627 [Cichorium intybus]
MEIRLGLAFLGDRCILLGDFSDWKGSYDHFRRLDASSGNMSLSASNHIYPGSGDVASGRKKGLEMLPELDNLVADDVIRIFEKDEDDEEIELSGECDVGK